MCLHTTSHGALCVLFAVSVILYPRTSVAETTPSKIASDGKSGSVVIAKTSLTCPLKPGTPSLATKEKSGLLCLDGVLGQWFSASSNRKLLKNLREGNAAIAREPLLQRQLELEKHHSKLLQLDIETSDRITAQWRLTAQMQAKELAARSSMWKSPTLWFAVGLVVATAAVSATVIVANK